MISIRSTLIAGGAPAGTVKSDAIPFRPDAVVSLPEAGGVLAAALLLLAAFYGLAWYARRAGWLGRWMGGRATSSNDARKLAVLERLVVSRKTVLYRIRDGEQEYLLVESSASAGLTASERQA